MVYVLEMAYRNKLDQRREECRQLVTKLLVSCLGTPVAKPLPDLQDNRVGEGDGKTVRVASKSMVLQ